MYGQIHAKSEIKDNSRGKTMRVWGDASALTFYSSYDDDDKVLIIKASCTEIFNGDDDNDASYYDEINRNLRLELNKEEVEKLATAILTVNQKLLKKFKISNLQAINPVGKLKLDIERLKGELDSDKREIKRLHKIINKAKTALNLSMKDKG